MTIQMQNGHMYIILFYLYIYADDLTVSAGQKRDRQMVLQNPRNQQCTYKIASISKGDKTSPQHHFFTFLSYF